jgi:hypothetical protein
MNKKVLTVGAVSVISLTTFLVVGVSTIYAYRGDATKVGPYHTVEREASMETIMANKDYAGWKTLMTQDGRTPGVLNKVNTQEKFNQFVEIYNLEHAGKDATVLRQKLGLGMQNGTGNGSGNGQGKGNGMHINR